MSFPPRTWDLLLIGGASGVGKSSVSYRLAQHFGVALIEVDDFQTVLQHMTTPEQFPALHFWDTHPDPRSLAPEVIFEQGKAIACELHPALELVIANHLETDRPAVLDGDFLTPALMVQAAYAGCENAGRVCGIVVDEPDEVQIVRNYGLREPGAGEQTQRARVSKLFGDWLKHDAERFGIQVVEARPWDTVFERVLDVLAAR